MNTTRARTKPEHVTVADPRREERDVDGDALIDAVRETEAPSEAPARQHSSGPKPNALAAKPGELHDDAEIAALRDRAAAYLAAGVPIHLRGPAGAGKTTLALDIAARRERPVSLLVGGREITSPDLIGRSVGETTRLVRDRYVQRVQRIESLTRTEWRDGILAEAMTHGHTLVYDEFTRTPPEANNALLSALEEGLLVFADPARADRLLVAHPEFRVILTSNPHDYAGVCAAPDALADRMITFELGWPSAATEAGMVAARSGLASREAEIVVALIRRLREGGAMAAPPSIRTAVLLARLLKSQGAPADPRDARFVQICLDVLTSRTIEGREAGGDLSALHEAVVSTIRRAAA